MKTSEANRVVTQALQFGLIDQNEAVRRTREIARVMRKYGRRAGTRHVAVIVEDLVAIVDSAERGGLVLTEV